MGTGIGWAAALLAGLVSPSVRRGNQVAAAAGYELSPYAGSEPLDTRCFFRFVNEQYARDFAAANA